MIWTYKNITSLLSFLLVFSIVFEEYLFSITGFKIRTSEVILLSLNLLYFISILNRVILKLKLNKLEIYFFMFIFTILISTIVNYEFNILQKLLGSYYLIKSLSVLMLVKIYGLTEKYLKYIYNIIIYSALISVSIQLFQLIPNINTISFGIIPEPYIKENFIRCTGLLGGVNRSALLLVIAFLVQRMKGDSLWNPKTFIFIVGLLLASSNLNIVLFLMIITFDIIRNYKLSSIPFLIIVGVFVAILGGSLFFRATQTFTLAVEHGTYFRLSAFITSIDVLSDNLLFGVGPGMYGGSVASIFGSPVHIQYNTFNYFLGSNATMPDTIDMFWPHFWAEVGIFGLFAFLSIFIVLLKSNKRDIFQYLLLCSIFISGISMMSLEAIYPSVIVYMLIGNNIS